MNRLDQVKALENGKGIQCLLDAAYEILGNPLAVFDLNYSLKAYTGASADDPLWNELISTGTFSMETQKFFASERFTEDVANTDKAVLLKSSKLKHDRIAGYIYNRDNIKVLNIVIIGCDCPFDGDYMAAFEELTDKITMEIHNDEYYTTYGRAYQEEIIIKLLDGIIREPVVYTGYLQILYDGFEGYLNVAVVAITQNGIKTQDRQNRLVSVKKLLESQYRSFKYAIYADYIVVLMSSKEKDFYGPSFFAPNTVFFEKNGLYMGISGSFENILETRLYYDQAVTALKNGKKSGSDQRVFLASAPGAQ